MDHSLAGHRPASDSLDVRFPEPPDRGPSRSPDMAENEEAKVKVGQISAGRGGDILAIHAGWFPYAKEAIDWSPESCRKTWSGNSGPATV